jgi:transcriptional regulator with XRE-family HTH domain
MLSMPTDDPLAVFGRKVRRLRGARRMSIPDLAARSGLSPLSITSIEGGEGVLSVSVLRALAKGLSIQPDELLRGLPMLSVTAETRHLFAFAPTFVSSMEGLRGLRGSKMGAGGELRHPKSAGARASGSRASRAGDVALLSVLRDAAAKRPPA